MPVETFTVEGPKLIIHADLEPGREEDLRAACDQLLDADEAELTVDLSAVKYIHSLSVGMLSYAWVEALSREKEMTFIVTQTVADVFERTGLAKVFNFQVAAE